MATEILMPALSPTMTEGKLAKWVKKEGDPVKSGDVIAEIETDKATMEVEAVDEGYLAKILVPEGTEGVAVNSVIALLAASPDEKVEIPAKPAAPAAPPPPSKPEAEKPPVPPAEAPAERGPQHEKAPPQGERIFASPLARRIAKQAGIDLSTIKGTGPNGRIVRADVEGHHAPARPETAAARPE
ncbi:biotin/lipoyl-containing protein, partial [Acidocella sp.]|uniref:biotin/lipoyl-containing protein n=1 Tax=Acidocella sp. TaxID=50710 RepID=UPI002630AD44